MNLMGFRDRPLREFSSHLDLGMPLCNVEFRVPCDGPDWTCINFSLCMAWLLLIALLRPTKEPFIICGIQQSPQQMACACHAMDESWQT